MTWMLRAGGAALLTGIAPAAMTQPAPARAATYYVERITTTIADDEKVGSRRMGVFCVPTGALHWRDIVPSRSMDEREVVADALDDDGLPVTNELLDHRQNMVQRIKGTVTAADFHVCAKLGGLRDAAVVGDVTLDVAWRVPGPGEEHAIKLTSHISRHLASKATIGTAYRDLLKDAAHDLAEQLKTTPPM